ncbi:glycosyl hydrolase [Dactylosporangium sp. NPDC051484]|uniref:glycoside hydrolase family 26 protein n=1 Tax=Dactylosporangium sp. NPDC051484 TaxID=3154942 RepID=UPI003450B9A8
MAVAIACAVAAYAVTVGAEKRRYPGIAASVPAPPASSSTRVDPKWPFVGAYTGPGAKGVERLRDWEAWSGVRTRFALDFAPADSWTLIEGGDWQLAPWADSGRRLIYSVPLFPKAQGNLSECAAGDYDGHWSALARNLVEHRLADTVVRPGWEFNGNWYGWASAGQESAYVACFRHVVDAMRAVYGQHFAFLWNPVLGTEFSAAEPAYPGDGYIDFVGIDVYDTSWVRGTYPVAADTSAERRAAVREAVWSTILDGSRGLRYWMRYAAAHGKRPVIPEWGLSERTDGHGGGDNPYFIERMLAFLADPANRPAFAMYFEAEAPLSGGLNEHRMALDPPVFPLAAARFRRLVASTDSADFGSDADRRQPPRSAGYGRFTRNVALTS